jgi:dTDP-4-amino-4,6-dideoxygalactose transaminase
LFQDAGLAEEITLPSVREGARHIFNQYVVRVGKRRDALIEHLKENDIGTDIYYPVPLHRQECFSYLENKEGEFPVAEQSAHETLALPIYPELTEEQQAYVVESILEFMG